MQHRAEFSEKTRRNLALRVGGLCSRPGCRVLTSGPRLDPDRALNIGVAAHITGASPGGPRYDGSLSDKDRSHSNNGIWLCQNCAKLIDNDTKRFTKEAIRGWKTRAEHYALWRMGQSGGQVDSDMNREEYDLLFAAAAGDGVLVFIDVQQGLGFVKAGEKMFGEVHEPMISASYIDALETLWRKGLISRTGRRAYRLTRKGYQSSGSAPTS